MYHNRRRSNMTLAALVMCLTYLAPTDASGSAQRQLADKTLDYTSRVPRRELYAETLSEQLEQLSDDPQILRFAESLSSGIGAIRIGLNMAEAVKA